MADGKGVLVVGEMTEGGIASITGELLGAGRRLADALGQELSTMFLGDGIGDTARGAFAQGADRVYAADSTLLKTYQPEFYAHVIEKLCQNLAPAVVIMGATPLGRDLAPRLAWRLQCGLASECLNLNIDPETRALIATRPVYGGKALAEVDCGPARPAMATVRARSQSPVAPGALRRGEVVSVAVSIDPTIARTRLVGSVTVEVEGVKLEDARVVVGGGRGLGSAENWKVLEALASDLKGAVGSTRGAVDEGYCDMATQLGVTAKSVSPELYLAVGISGASQHMSGVSFSRHIACINRDANAPIFKEAEFGVVGRWEEVLPAFHRKIRELLSD
ncbi:MAG: electron transfer flavoprotein subunit alpha/FixB family protein [Chloroflexi bacterium]|nr:electron transfer flavoprotein subunit alpha/FixB family protein [Chloroflexota bacterium]